MKKIPLDVLEKKAQQISKSVLNEYILPDDLFSQLTLNTVIEGDDRIFVLYIPKEPAKDSIDILRIRMNIYTGEGFAEYVGLERKDEM